MAPMLQVEKALEAIKAGLIAGRWQPGDRLVLEPLAEELGISVTPVRDAVNELVTQGMLERRPGIGTSVTEHTAQELADLWELRALLEGQAARWLAERASDVALAALTAEAEALDEFLVTAYPELERLHAGPEYNSLRLRVVRTDDKFHYHLIEYADSRGLLIAWKPCHFLLLTAIASPYVSEWHPSAGQLPRHAHLMAAVASRDPDLADEAGRAHVLSGREALLADLAAGTDEALGSEAQRAVMAEGR